jgi:hypothetical protein
LYDKLFAATHFTLNVSQYEYAGLYLPYAATIPAEATAYIITDASVDGVATLQAVEGDVLPANTAVIVNAPEGEYAFDADAVARVVRVSLGGLWFDLMATQHPYPIEEALSSMFQLAMAFFPRHFNKAGALAI